MQPGLQLNPLRTWSICGMGAIGIGYYPLSNMHHIGNDRGSSYVTGAFPRSVALWKLYRTIIRTTHSVRSHPRHSKTISDRQGGSSYFSETLRYMARNVQLLYHCKGHTYFWCFA